MLNKGEEVNFTELLYKITEWFKYLRSKWVTLLVSCFIAGIIGCVCALFANPKYSAQETFVLASNSKSGGLAALAGQLGYDFGSNSDDVFAGDNIIELFKSKRIITGALFRVVPGSNKTLLTLFVEKNKLDKYWKTKENLQNVYPFPNDIKKTTPVQDSLITEVHELIVRKYISIGKPDKKLNIYSLTATCGYQDLAYYLTKFILAEASHFYIETKTQTAKLNLNMLQHEADSLRNLLGNSITNTGNAADQIYNLNPAYQVRRSTTQQGQVNTTVLSAAYGEVVKNLELAKITLQKETPLYQVIDEPGTLLKMQKTSKLLTGIYFAIATVFCVIVFLVIKRVLATTPQSAE